MRNARTRSSSRTASTSSWRWSIIKDDIIAYARSLGFGRMGVTSAEAADASERRLEQWLGKGHAGEMAYMEKNWQVRARPAEQLPGAKSVIALAVNYYNRDGGSAGRRVGERRFSADPPIRRSSDPVAVGRIARYAWGKDYHKVIEKRLDALVRYIEALAPDVRCKTFVDTGPLLERAFAQKSGLGFVGKNTMLITRGLGSWVFLAHVLTTLELPSDGPDTRTCGSCTLCIDACPTQALTGPYQLDARRCIAYLTIESKKPIPEDLSPRIGNWFFGCDICQEVCPHNTRVPPTPIAEFKAEAGVGPTLNPDEVLSLKTDQEFDARFAGTPLKRAKRQGLQRNARLVRENQSVLEAVDKTLLKTKFPVH